MLREFLNPRHWSPSAARDFFFNYDQICQLCDQAERIFQQEPSVLKLRGERGAGAAWETALCGACGPLCRLGQSGRPQQCCLLP